MQSINQRVSRSSAMNMVGPYLTLEAFCPYCEKNNVLLHIESRSSPAKVHDVCKHLVAIDYDENDDDFVLEFDSNRGLPKSLQLQNHTFDLVYTTGHVGHHHYAWGLLRGRPIATFSFYDQVMLPSCKGRALLAAETFQASDGFWSYSGHEATPSFVDPLDMIARASFLTIETYTHFYRHHQIETEVNNVYSRFAIWHAPLAAECYRKAFARFGKRSWNSCTSHVLISLTDQGVLSHDEHSGI